MKEYSHHNVKLKPIDEAQRFEQIKRNIPSFTTQEFKDLLYIGVAKNRFQFQTYLNNLNYNITILEAHTPNLEKYVDKYTLINADVTKFETKNKWDVIMWWHGPEHISKEELKPILQKLEFMANKLVILGCPWGMCLQGVYSGNPYQVHKNHIYPLDLLELNYSVETIGKSDLPGSNLLAWKFVNT